MLDIISIIQNNKVNQTSEHKYGSRIVGGRDTQEGQFPWLVRLQINRFMCGGSLITLKHILTAAHCLTKHEKSDQMVDLR